MGAPGITDWLSSIGSVAAAIGGLVAAPAAICAALYTKRAAEAAERAVTEAAKQVREIQIQREPRAVIKVRIPGPFSVEQYVKYGHGDGEFRTGPPIYVDLWNISGPTIMIMEIDVWVTSVPEIKNFRVYGPMTPQLLVESGKVVSSNIAYQIMSRVASNPQSIDFPDETKAAAHLKVKYFSLGVEKVIETDCSLTFRVTAQNIVPWLNEPPTT